MASRKEEKERLRQERMEREAAERSRKEKQAKARNIALVIAAVAAIVAVVAVLALAGGGGDDDSSGGDGDKSGLDADGFPTAGPAPASALKIADEVTQDKLLETAKAGDCTYQEPTNEGRTHEEDPEFKFEFKANPPTSGDHTPDWPEDLAYTEGEDLPQQAMFVHSLEHGRVHYQWNPKKITDAQLATLKKLYDDEKYHLVLSPNQTDMPYVVAATAWDRSLTCSSINDKTWEAMRMFHVTWLDQGPENVP